MSTELDRLAELTKADKTTRFLSIAHLLTPVALLAAFEGLRKDASAGVDEVTYRESEPDVWLKIPTLHHRPGMSLPFFRSATSRATAEHCRLTSKWSRRALARERARLIWHVSWTKEDCGSQS